MSCVKVEVAVLPNSHGLWGRKATVSVKVNLLVPLMESPETMLVEETRHEARCFGAVAPGYEACCVPLHSLHLVNVCPSASRVSVLLYVNTDRTDYKGRGAEDVHLTFHIAPEI